LGFEIWDCGFVISLEFNPKSQNVWRDSKLFTPFDLLKIDACRFTAWKGKKFTNLSLRSAPKNFLTINSKTSRVSVRGWKIRRKNYTGEKRSSALHKNKKQQKIFDKNDPFHGKNTRRITVSNLSSKGIRMRTAQIFIVILMFLVVLTLAVNANAATIKTTRALPLGDSRVSVNIYENPGASVTFFAPHHNEQIGLNLAKDYVNRNGGRLIEIESTDERGVPMRYVKFTAGGKNYTIDPNRIYTDNGRSCNVASEVRDSVKTFAGELLKIILDADGKTLRSGERFIVAVHNNTDVSSKNSSAQSADLTAVAFIRAQSTDNLRHGAFEAQADGVFLSNTETDEDNFIFLSTPAHIGYFAEKGFNVVVQKPAAKLQSKQCTVDDGSLSVYSGQAAIPYICLEADGTGGFARQRQMLEAVYALLQPEQKQIEVVTVAVKK